MAKDIWGYETGTAPAKTKYRTQKARGVVALEANGFTVPPFTVYKIEELLYHADGEQLRLFPAVQPDGLLKKFARPCPTVPRHGFVDSRVISTHAEAEKLILDTFAAEPLAEVISMVPIAAEYSGIWTPGKLVIGKGTDGATAGTSSRAITAVGTPHKHDEYRGNAIEEYFNQALQDADITEAPYLELLWKTPKYSQTFNETRAIEFENYYVQLRNGPKLPASVDFVPEKMTVETVVLADGDLLEWETKVKTFAKGTVIHHPNGSLASHYAVHAVLSNIPVLVSREPKAGDILEPTTDGPVTADIEKLRFGFYRGCTSKLDMVTATRVMLIACHSLSAWYGKEDYLLGFAMGCAYRLIITAALGEARHAPSRKRKAGRGTIYKKVWNKILSPSTRARYLQALDCFANENWSSSYGGQKWLDLSMFAATIYNGIIAGDAKTASEQLNLACHAVHNGGWAFDKFTSKREMNLASALPVKLMLQCAPQIYDILEEGDTPLDSPEWTKGKHAIDIDAAIGGQASDSESDVAEAKADEKEELQEEGYESNTFCQDGDGEKCGDDSCEECYPSNDSEASEESNSEPDISSIISAQAKLVKIDASPAAYKLHVQCKIKGNGEHVSFDVKVDKAYHNLVCKSWEASPKVASLYSKSQADYTLLNNHGGTAWSIGSLLKTQFYFNFGKV